MHYGTRHRKNVFGNICIVDVYLECDIIQMRNLDSNQEGKSKKHSKCGVTERRFTVVRQSDK